MADWSCRERNLPQPIRSTSRIVRTFYTCLHRLRFASSSFSRKLNRIVQYTSLTDNIVDSLQNNSREREKGRKKKKKNKPELYFSMGAILSSVQFIQTGHFTQIHSFFVGIITEKYCRQLTTQQQRKGKKQISLSCTFNGSYFVFCLPYSNWPFHSNLFIFRQRYH